MIAATSALSRRLRPLLAAVSLGVAAVLISPSAFARGPEAIADVAGKVQNTDLHDASLREGLDGGDWAARLRRRYSSRAMRE